MNYYRVLAQIKEPPETLVAQQVPGHWRKFFESLNDSELIAVRWWLFDSGNGYRAMLSPLTAWRKWQIEAKQVLKKSEGRLAA